MKKWRNKVWKANELHWLKHNEGTYTINDLMHRFNIPRHTAFYVVEKHKFEFIKAPSGFKKGNKLTYLKKNINHENFANTSVSGESKKELRKCIRVAKQGW